VNLTAQLPEEIPRATKKFQAQSEARRLRSIERLSLTHFATAKDLL